MKNTNHIFKIKFEIADTNLPDDNTQEMYKYVGEFLSILFTY